MRKFRGRVALLGAAMIVGGMLAGCGRSSTSTTNNAAAPTSTGQAEAETKAAPAALHLAQGSYSVAAPGTTISGTVSKGASLSINGNEIPVHAGHWHYRLHLHIGSNPIEVEATTSGTTPTTRTIHVVRHHSATELEAKARARAQRAEEKKRHEAERREHKEREEREKQERESAPPPGSCPNGTYENSSGNIVCKPYAPSNGEQPAGTTAECEDGTYSFSEHRSGTCSSHGGVAVWLNE